MRDIILKLELETPALGLGSWVVYTMDLLHASCGIWELEEASLMNELLMVLQASHFTLPATTANSRRRFTSINRLILIILMVFCYRVHWGINLSLVNIQYKLHFTTGIDRGGGDMLTA